MTITRGISLAILVPAATAWAGCLVVAGLWLALDVRAAGGPGLLGGLAAVAAGQFVFMAAVADRLFPNPGWNRTIWLVEMATFLAAGVLGVAAALLFLRGAWR